MPPDTIPTPSRAAPEQPPSLIQVLQKWARDRRDANADTPSGPRPNGVFSAVYLLLMMVMGFFGLKAMFASLGGDNALANRFGHAMTLVICVALSIQSTILSFNPRMVKVAYFSLACIVCLLFGQVYLIFRH